jgi:hypothetical protein
MQQGSGLPALLPVTVAAPPISTLAQTQHASSAAPSSWSAVEGGLGGLASRFGADQGASSLARAQEAAWNAAAGDDRALSISSRIEQSFDTSSALQSSMDAHIESSNRGFRLLCKMGWGGVGQPLGRRGDGIVEPVRLAEQYGSLGLGKATEYADYATAATETRRAMTSEVIAAEDADGRAAREAEEARKQSIADARKREVANFYCDVTRSRTPAHHARAPSATGAAAETARLANRLVLRGWYFGRAPSRARAPAVAAGVRQAVHQSDGV